MHACQIGPTDTAPPCLGSPHKACVVTRGNMDIHKQLKEVYGETCMSLVMVRKRVKQFAKRRTDVHSLPGSKRLSDDLQCSKRLSDIMSSGNVQWLHNLLEEDRPMMILGQMNMEIHKQLKEVYGETCMSLVMVRKWVKQFAKGRTDVRNLQCSKRLSDDLQCSKLLSDNLQCSKRLLDSMLSGNVQWLHNLLEEDRPMMILELYFHLQARKVSK